MVDDDSIENASFDKNLLQKMLLKSYSPFSKFRVAACVESVNGQFYYGCNVENSTIGATICAERTAIVKMVSSEGPTARIKRVYILGETDEPLSPCGICRQSIYEFVDDDAEIVMFSKGFAKKKVDKLSFLFPQGFKL
jgi:cytidine deaminase